MLKRDLLRINRYLKSRNHDPWVRPASEEEEESGAKWIVRPDKAHPFHDVKIGKFFLDGIALGPDWSFIGIFYRKEFKPMKIEELLPRRKPPE
jgi:hypothetical protein